MQIDPNAKIYVLTQNCMIIVDNRQFIYPMVEGVKNGEWFLNGLFREIVEINWIGS
jgi:hypothetical protein